MWIGAAETGPARLVLVRKHDGDDRLGVISRSTESFELDRLRWLVVLIADEKLEIQSGACGRAAPDDIGRRSQRNTDRMVGDASAKVDPMDHDPSLTCTGTYAGLRL